MKVRYNGGYYLQKFDLALIINHAVNIPACFTEECEKWMDGFEIRDDYFAFVGPFVQNESLNWIDKLDFVVSYDEYSGVPVRTISKAIRKQEKEIYRLEMSARRIRWGWGKRVNFEEMPDDTEVENLRAIYRQIRQIDQRLAALELLRGQREGLIKFEFPDGYDPTPLHSDKKRGIFGRLFGHYRVP